MTISRLRAGMLCLAMFAVAVFLCPDFTHAQGTTEGAIAGTVSDPSGAVVANARIAVVNEGTNQKFETASDDQGYFRVTHLQPATYTVNISAPGFGEYAAQHTLVTVGSVTTVDAHVTVGTTGQTVEVSGEVPLINLESPELASTVGQEQINSLPINGGRWSSFALLTPGAVSNSSGFGLLSFRGTSGF